MNYGGRGMYYRTGSLEYVEMRRKQVEQLKKRQKLSPEELAKRKADLLKKVQRTAN